MMEDCAWLTLARFLSVAPISATEPSVQLDFESGIIAAEGPQTAGILMQPSQTVAEDVFFGQWHQNEA